MHVHVGRKNYSRVNYGMVMLILFVTYVSQARTYDCAIGIPVIKPVVRSATYENYLIFHVHIPGAWIRGDIPVIKPATKTAVHR